MKLTRVTITGADDQVDQRSLFALIDSFPFLEVGILYSHDRLGTARYPTDKWRESLLSHGRYEGHRFALHLCGQAARDAMAGDADELPRIWTGWRVQLNGFSRFRLPGLKLAKALPGEGFVLQCNTAEALNEALTLSCRYPNVSALYDVSGGAGRYLPEAWPVAPGRLRLGYAGGLNEFNIEEALRILTSLPGGDFWIDLETGARNARDEFDLAKARRVLELAKPFVEAA